VKVVCNSSVLISLSAIGRLNLLRKIFTKDEILIPNAVWKEVVLDGGERQGVQEVKSAEWIHRESVKDTTMVKTLQAYLDLGEAEAITLAKETGATLIVLDEKDAREIAERLDLKLLGTIGVLIRAKRKGHVQSLRDELDLLKDKGKFWITEELYKEALREEKED